MLNVGDIAPNFQAPSHDGQELDLDQLLRTGPVVLFFYPKDESLGCTEEACHFRDVHAEFLEHGAHVVGVSTDDLASHRRFAARHALPYPLVFDQDGRLRKAFGVPRSWGFMPARVTFVIGSGRRVVHAFNSQLRTKQHVEEALAAVRKLESSTHRDAQPSAP